MASTSTKNEMSRPTTAEPKPVRGQHYLNKVQSLWSEASAKQESAAKPLTKEQKLRAMLGYQELADGQRNPVFWREDFCGVCGTQHLNPDVLDTYPYCERCQSPLRSPAHLRKRFEPLEPRQYLEILFASYGDQITEKGAVDVTHRVKVYQLHKHTHTHTPSSLQKSIYHSNHTHSCNNRVSWRRKRPRSTWPLVLQ